MTKKKIYSTYCSEKKKKDPKWLPAIERYDSLRIKTISKKACEANVDFYIISGLYGLIHSNKHKIPNYDHRLTPDGVGNLSEIVAYQLKMYSINDVTYFTRSLVADPAIRPYHDTIAAACSKISISCRVKVNDW